MTFSRGVQTPNAMTLCSQFLFSTAIEVERSEPSVEPGTIIPKGLGIIYMCSLILELIHSIYRKLETRSCP